MAGKSEVASCATQVVVQVKQMAKRTIKVL